jgi:A/G-specific adenine glycosylase
VVSEFMLQQTRVGTVIPYFLRWMKALPDWNALAAAAPSEVMGLWEGLGYYSRARRLHGLARTLAAMPGPPRTAAAWRGMPGVGPYTSAAIASIAFNDPSACVDGNVVRILARLSADGTRFRDSGSAAAAFSDAASRLLSRASPGDFNQAMMELGATVCVRNNPLCAACPVSGFCAAFRKGDPGRYPRLARRPVETRSVVRVWCERRAALLLYLGPEDGRRLAGLFEIPTAEQAGIDPILAAEAPRLLVRSRSITRYRIREHIHAAPAPSGPPAAGLRWVPLRGLGAIVLSGPHRRWIAEILGLPRARRVIRSGPQRAISS